MRPTPPRRGYAMLLVVVFMVLFFALWSVAYHQMAADLRFEAVQAQRVLRDEGSTQALAQALALLETGLPPSQPYACGVTVNTSTGPRSFAVTFSLEGPNQWSVQAAPLQLGENPPPMPVTFAP